MKPVVGELVFCSGKYCIIIFVFNVSFGALAVFLNGTVLAALLRIAKRQEWKIPNVILFGMVLTDLCTGLICQPLHAYFILRQENIYNEADLGVFEAWLFFALNYCSYVLCCTSLLITVIMSLERLTAVAYAMKHRSTANLSRTIAILLIATVISIVIPIFRFVSERTHLLFMALLVLVVILALVTITVAYVMLFRSFKQQRLAAVKLSSAEKDRVRGLKQERNLAKTFALLTSVIIIMYLPQMLLKPISIALDVKQGSVTGKIFVILEDTFNTVLYSNSVVNPFIYFFKHDSVHEEIRSIFSCCKGAGVSNMETSSKASKITKSTVTENDLKGYDTRL